MQNSGQDYSSYEYVSRMGPCNFYSISQNCMVNFDKKMFHLKQYFNIKNRTTKSRFWNDYQFMKCDDAATRLCLHSLSGTGLLVWYNVPSLHYFIINVCIKLCLTHSGEKYTQSTIFPINPFPDLFIIYSYYITASIKCCVYISNALRGVENMDIG